MPGGGSYARRLDAYGRIMKTVVTTGLIVMAGVWGSLVIPGCRWHTSAPVGHQTFRGMANASAAVMLDARHLLAAGDEDNVLRLYDLDRPGPPIRSFDWTPHLAITDREHAEVDIEAAAAHGNVVYWIGSHGRNRNGKWRANRHRLFATRIAGATPEAWRPEPLGPSRQDLVAALLRADGFKSTPIAAAIGAVGRPAPALTPSRGGFNIEGLACSPDGETLWIGLRSPLDKGRALLIPLERPAALFTDPPGPMTFGPPVRLDLGGRGIRDMVYDPEGDAYVLLAGPSTGRESDFALYRWSGDAHDPPRTIPLDMLPGAPTALTPEAIVPVAGISNAWLLISDDGRADDQPAPLVPERPGAWVRQESPDAYFRSILHIHK